MAPESSEQDQQVVLENYNSTGVDDAAKIAIRIAILRSQTKVSSIDRSFLARSPQRCAGMG